MTETHLTQVEFASLVLDPRLKTGLEDVGFTHCTPIQAETLPAALRGEDVAGQAQTGTGKTAAFLLSTFHRLLTEDADFRDAGGAAAPRAIIIAPTRELALQIHKDGRNLGAHAGLRLALAYGGTDYDEQRERIAGGVDVLIGTPGRLIDYYKQGVYTLDAIRVAVLDEADRMFDLGFIRDMRYLLRRMPPREARLNMLFSATLSHRVMELAYEHMNDPRTVRVTPERPVADGVREAVYFPANAEKIPLLLGLLRKLDPGRILVFTNTRHAASKVGDWLKANGHGTGVLTGEVPQKRRERLLEAFRKGTTDILVATDVAARGLHIPDVSHVLNYDLPQDAEDYVHRIGRTARAGAEGDAISFACEDTAAYLMDIEEYIGHGIPRAEFEPDILADARKPERRESGAARERNGRRGSGDDRRRGRSGAERRGPARPAPRARVEPQVETRVETQVEPQIEMQIEAQAEPPRTATDAPPPDTRRDDLDVEVPAIG